MGSFMAPAQQPGGFFGNDFMMQLQQLLKGIGGQFGGGAGGGQVQAPQQMPQFPGMTQPNNPGIPQIDPVTGKLKQPRTNPGSFINEQPATPSPRRGNINPIFGNPAGPNAPQPQAPRMMSLGSLLGLGQSNTAQAVSQSQRPVTPRAMQPYKPTANAAY
jgi:hypothetical protein